MLLEQDYELFEKVLRENVALFRKRTDALFNKLRMASNKKGKISEKMLHSVLSKDIENVENEMTMNQMRAYLELLANVAALIENGMDVNRCQNFLFYSYGHVFGRVNSLNNNMSLLIAQSNMKLRKIIAFDFEGAIDQYYKSFISYNTIEHVNGPVFMVDLIPNRSKDEKLSYVEVHDKENIDLSEEPIVYGNKLFFMVNEVLGEKGIENFAEIFDEAFFIIGTNKPKKGEMNQVMALDMKKLEQAIDKKYAKRFPEYPYY